jgi:phytoene synthase
MAERRLDFDREVALQQLPARVRPAFQALWELDLALADVVATSTDAELGAIRLAWWRERLEELDLGKEPLAEPRLQSVVAGLLPRGVTGRELSSLEHAWLPLLEPFPWGDRQAEAIRLRGRILFGIGAHLLDWDRAEAEPAGALWSLVDGAAHCSDVHSRMFLLDQARKMIRDLPGPRPPRRARGLTVLAALAGHEALRNKPLDVGRDWGRVAVATIHGLRGSFPRG